MKFLLDTRLLLCAAGDLDLPAEARELLSRQDHEFMFSPISLAVLAQPPAALGLELDGDLASFRRELLSSGYGELPLNGAHVAAMALLPLPDADFFERGLVAQAIVEGVTLLTDDTALLRYPGPIRHVT